MISTRRSKFGDRHAKQKKQPSSAKIVAKNNCYCPYKKIHYCKTEETI